MARVEKFKEGSPQLWGWKFGLRTASLSLLGFPDVLAFLGQIFVFSQSYFFTTPNIFKVMFWFY